MCVICRSQPCVIGALDDGTPSPDSATTSTSTSGANKSVLSIVPATVPGPAQWQALISGYSWTGGSVTFGFATSAADYLGIPYSGYNEPSSFLTMSAFGQDLIRMAISNWQGVSALTIVEAASGAHPAINIGGSTVPSTAWAYYPFSTTADSAGDIWFGVDKSFFSKLIGSEVPYLGSYEYATALHEFGHALGLKHPHQSTPVLDPAYDGLEYSVMSYRSYLGGPTSYYTVEAWGYPQSLMMLDIAAIQQIYGADFATEAGNTTYHFDPVTGEMTVNGVSAGVPGANRVFRTIWDGNGTDTLDLSAYSTNLRIDLNPGMGTDLNVTGFAQRAKLGTDSTGATIYAANHIYMSLLYDGDTRSLIENAMGGIGDDTLIGNQTANLLSGGDGADTFTGGAGADVFVFGAGADTLRDTLAGLDGDQVTDFDLAADRVIVTGLDLTAGVAVYDAVTGQFTIDADGDGTVDATLWLPSGLVSSGPVLTTFSDGTEIRLGAQASAGNNPLPPAVTVTLGTSSDIYVNQTGTALAVYGLAGADQITLGSGDDLIVGGDGNDKLWGMDGADTIQGDLGTDMVYGGEGNDLLYGGAGTDTAYGGTGNDTIYGGTESDKLYGEEGDDLIYGEAGNDTIDGGDDQDAIWGDAGADILYGGAGNDVIRGGADSDKIYGDAGNDILFSGAGTRDYMTGGAGQDQFVIDFADFTAGVTASDYITDYTFGVDAVRFIGMSVSALTELSPRDTTSGLRLTLGTSNYVYFTGVTVAQLSEIGVIFDDGQHGYLV